MCLKQGDIEDIDGNKQQNKNRQRNKNTKRCCLGVSRKSASISSYEVAQKFGERSIKTRGEAAIQSPQQHRRLS